MSQRLMCVTAHPDDEAAGFGAALLQAADRGAQTAVLCLTEGNAGSRREPGQSDRELATVRRAEFTAACAALGVRQADMLRYPDGKLWQEPFAELVGVLVERLRRFRPQVVLTFGAEGGPNLHRDHTVVSLAATAAFHWAGRSGYYPEQLGTLEPWAPQKLYYQATSVLVTGDEEARDAGTLVPASLTYRLSEELERRKWAAFAEHRSQAALLTKLRSEHPVLLHTERYLLVAARKPVEGEQDLWDGVEA